MTADQFDTVVIGGGIAGMSTAARLQSRGLSTAVLERHDHVGGCAGYYRTDGFTFDVGATTLIDFHTAGVGGQFFDAIGFDPPPMSLQRAFSVWLPDRTVTLYRDRELWKRERRSKLGSSDRHLEFYQFIDSLADALWRLIRQDVKLPIQSLSDLYQNWRSAQLRDLRLVRYFRWTMADALRRYDVYQDDPLRETIALLVEDAVHSPLDEAPLLNAVLGMTMRRTGIARAKGGMFGFWNAFCDHYTDLGGVLRTGETVTAVRGTDGAFTIETSERSYNAERVVSALPISLTNQIAEPVLGDTLEPYVEARQEYEGGAIVVTLGVPETEVDDHEVTHHKVMVERGGAMESCKTIFISVSEPGDQISAPPGHRAVMLSTHCALERWQQLDAESYDRRKSTVKQNLIEGARTVYPDLGTDPVVVDVATPRTFERYTNRPRGAVGGYRKTVRTANQSAVPHDIGIDGFYLAGDTTWPGLGMLACVKGSKVVADHICG
jgi:C-3',4' desaturase CrtD